MLHKRKALKKLVIPIFCLCLFLYIFIELNLKNKLMPIKNRIDVLKIIESNNSRPAYIIDLPGCRMPYFRVIDDNIIQYMYKPRNFKCKKALLRPSEVSLGNCNGLKLNMNAEEILEQYSLYSLNEVQCKYTEVKRTTDQRNSYMKSIPFKLVYNSTILINCNIEFLMVECWNKSMESFYKDFYFFVVNSIKTNGENQNNLIAEDVKISSKTEKYHKKLQQDYKTKQQEDDISVMILGIDSVSHLNFLRQMRSTASYIHKKLNYVEFWGYNKIGDNTYPNLIPVLTGFDAEELEISCLGSSKHHNVYDNCSFIWNRFKEAGYTTIYGEDVGYLSLFNWGHSGFKNRPTDYYLRPIVLEMERFISYQKTLNMALCMGGRRTHNVLLDYIRNLTPVMVSKKFMAFYWSVSMTHDLFNMPILIDDDIKQLMETLTLNHITNRTIIFFMSDHGIRWGSFRKTYQGMMEERLPLLIAIYPSWFEKKYSQAIANMKINSKRLTTPYDVYATMLDLLDLRNIEVKQLKQRELDLNDLNVNMPRSISLFLPIPKDRTCEKANIASHWCCCHQHKKLASNDARVQRAARYIVKLINNRLKGRPQCRTLYLNTIVDSTIASPHNKILKELDANDYSIDITLQLQTKPGLGLYESTVRMSSYNISLTGSISRINVYSSQSYCIDDYSLKLFCYCHR